MRLDVKLALALALGVLAVGCLPANPKRAAVAHTEEYVPETQTWVKVAGVVLYKTDPLYARLVRIEGEKAALTNDYLLGRVEEERYQATAAAVGSASARLTPALRSREGEWTTDQEEMRLEPLLRDVEGHLGIGR